MSKMGANGQSYSDFLARKSQIGGNDGFEPLWLPDELANGHRIKPFQRHALGWAIRRGRAALFEDCGLGKTLQELIFGTNCAMKTKLPNIIITPLAVAAQTVREAEKFGIEAKVSRDGTPHYPNTVTNYESLHKFDASQYGSGVLDESSCIKAFDGKRRRQIVRFFNKMRYRLLGTATPSPNDFIELGTQSECLGVMTQSDMLGYFFRDVDLARHTVFREEDFWNKCKYIFKPHSEQPFWRWVSSWARAIRTPSDIGFSDDGYVLPELIYQQHTLNIPFVPDGELFHRPAVTIREQIGERKRTVNERCEKLADLLSGNEPGIAWCHYNEEGTTLTKMIPGAVEVAGRHSDEYKEAALNDFAIGNIRVLVTKAQIGCWGMNFQRCGNIGTFPTFSFEQFYQLVRRCWRFGREGPVKVHVVSAEGESRVIEGLDAKRRQATRMYASLVKHMNDALAMMSEDKHHKDVDMPDWLATAVAATPPQELVTCQ